MIDAGMLTNTLDLPCSCKGVWFYVHCHFPTAVASCPDEISPSWQAWGIMCGFLAVCILSHEEAWGEFPNLGKGNWSEISRRTMFTTTSSKTASLASPGRPQGLFPLDVIIASGEFLM